MRKANEIKDNVELKSAMKQFDVLSFISKHTPQEKRKLITRISLFFFHSRKWCKDVTAQLIEVGFLETENGKLKTTENLECYVKDLNHQIKKYKKTVRETVNERKRYLREYREKIEREAGNPKFDGGR